MRELSIRGVQVDRRYVLYRCKKFRAPLRICKSYFKLRKNVDIVTTDGILLRGLGGLVSASTVRGAFTFSRQCPALVFGIRQLRAVLDGNFTTFLEHTPPLLSLCIGTQNTEHRQEWEGRTFKIMLP